MSHSRPCTQWSIQNAVIQGETWTVGIKGLLAHEDGVKRIWEGFWSGHAFSDIQLGHGLRSIRSKGTRMDRGAFPKVLSSPTSERPALLGLGRGPDEVLIMLIEQEKILGFRDFIALVALW